MSTKATKRGFFIGFLKVIKKFANNPLLKTLYTFLFQIQKLIVSLPSNKNRQTKRSLNY